MENTIKRINNSKDEFVGYIHECPGCKSHHVFFTEPAANRSLWVFINNDMVKPTFSPSMLVNRDCYTKEMPRCHYFLREGIIEYLSDCTHNLANKKVPLKILRVKKDTPE